MITGRVTDAAVTCGPAAWHHGWQRTDFDQLAGGVVAGHVIECSAQATGGNYSFFHEIEGRDEVGGRARFGFPWAEVAADGSSVIGKHDGTGGAVNVGTVTSQMLYEISGPEYLGPDVTARFDTIELDQVASRPGADLRCARAGAAGHAEGGDERTRRIPQLVHRRADRARHRREGGVRRGHVLGRVPVRPRRLRFDRAAGSSAPTSPIPTTQEEATAIWRVTVKDPRRTQGRPGVRRRDGAHRAGRHPRDVRPRRRARCRRHRSACIARRRCRATSCRSTSTSTATTRPDRLGRADRSIRWSGPTTGRVVLGVGSGTDLRPSGERSVEVPLGAFVGTRSGDKGGDANLGVYARGDAGWAWLDHELTVDRLRELLPETADMPIDRYRFPTCARSTS